MKTARWGMGILVACAGSAGLAAETNGPAFDSNLARGRPCRLEPRPAYRYCTDADDAKQLTDGLYTRGYFWTRKSTVGWTHVPMAQITIDLGRVEPIDGVSFNTAAGVAGVGWPTAIEVWVSEDGKRYYPAGELVTLSASRGLPPAEGYRVHCYWTDRLATHGRWVKLMVTAGSPFLFADEIEIHRGPDALLARPFESEPVTDVGAHFVRGQMRAAIARRLVQDARAVRSAITNVPGVDRVRLEAELDSVLTAVSGVPDAEPTAFRAELPLNSLHARIFRVQAAGWRAAGCASLSARPAGPWDPLSVTDAPPVAPAAPRVEVALMAGESRPGTFLLCNAGERDAALRVSIEGIPGGDNPEWITVSEAVWTDTKRGVPVADALRPAQRGPGGFEISVPSGMTRLIWLEFHPETIPAGTHEGRAVVRGGLEGDLVVPLRVRVSPLRFPDRVSLSLGGWDYTDTERRYAVTPENRTRVIGMLKRYGVDTPWATSAVMPRVPSPDFSALDEWVRRWTGARHWRVFLSVGRTFGDTEIGTAAFETRVGAWIRTVADHWRGLGLRTDRLGLLLVDEPHEAAQDAIISAWARAIRAAGTGILIWEDPTWKNPAESRGVFELCDVLCPNRPMFLSGGSAFREVFARERAAGRTLNFYSCSGPVRLLDPYTYHRLQAWTCWREGATAEFFWAFGDAGGDSAWNEYTAPGTCYTPLFIDPRTVFSSRHMEAVREGLGDFEYLRMLRDRVELLRTSGPSFPALEAAVDCLASAPGRVLETSGADRMNWTEPRDRTCADRVRKDLLDALEALEVRPAAGVRTGP